MAALLSVLPIAFASPYPPGTPPYKTVYQFAKGVWLENLVQRANGNLLVTVATPSPDVYEINPSAEPHSQSAKLVATIPEATSALSIVELDVPDAFMVAANNFSLATPRPARQEA